jgi:hypothetical protein
MIANEFGVIILLKRHTEKHMLNVYEIRMICSSIRKATQNSNVVFRKDS